MNPYTEQELQAILSDDRTPPLAILGAIMRMAELKTGQKFEKEKDPVEYANDRTEQDWA